MSYVELAICGESWDCMNLRESYVACIIYIRITLPQTNIAPKNGWLEYYFPIGEAYFQVLC